MTRAAEMTGPLVAVIGAAGGSGATLAAMGLALASRQAHDEVWLVDMDLERGDIAAAWDLPARRTLVDLAAVSDELGSEHLRRAAARHESGVWVLASPGSLATRARWGSGQSRALGVAIASRGSAVIDLGAGGDRAAPLLDGARSVLLVCPATLAGARRAGRMVEGWRDSPIAGRLDLVWSRGAQRPAVSARALGRALGVDVVASLPWSPREAREIGAGRMPQGRRTRLAPALAALAESLG